VECDTQHAKFSRDVAVSAFYHHVYGTRDKADLDTGNSS